MPLEQRMIRVVEPKKAVAITAFFRRNKFERQERLGINSAIRSSIDRGLSAVLVSMQIRFEACF